MASKAYTLVMEERKKLTEIIISNLEKDGLNWVKGWSSKFAPHNATTEKAYRGGNKIKLMVTADQRGYDDPRWVTFNQAKEKGWQVKKGSKSVALEKWIFSKKEIDKVTKEEKTVKLNNPIVNYFRVFNANDIKGIPEFEKETRLEKTNEELTELIADLKRSSECEIKEEKQDRAYYSSLQDHIVLPPEEAFISQEQYLGTMLHEMGHSTGHSSRLNRPLGNGFGSVDYAKEELRAEISAIFSQKELGIELKTEHIDNHSAYINSWIQVLKKDPNEIYKASSDAEKITDRLIDNYNKLEKELKKDKSFKFEPLDKMRITYHGSEYKFDIKDNTVLRGKKAYDFFKKIMKVDKEVNQERENPENPSYYKTHISFRYGGFKKEKFRIDLGDLEFGESEKVSEALNYRLKSYTKELMRDLNFYANHYDIEAENLKGQVKEMNEEIDGVITHLKKVEKEMVNEKETIEPSLKAVGVGYSFNLFDEKTLNGLSLEETTTNLKVEDKEYKLFKATSYEESKQVDKLLDKHGELKIDDYQLDNSKIINPYNTSKIANPYEVKIKNPYSLSNSNEDELER